jgi:integrase/recombinase XerD
VSPRKLPEVLTADEVEAIFRRPNQQAPTGLRNLAMMTVMYRCGLRVGEVCGLHLRDVEWKEKRIHLRPGVAKGGHEAYVPIGGQTEQLLERWVAIRRKHAAGKPHLFTTLKGAPVDRRYVWEMVRRYGRRAELERDVHPHLLRHTFASELLGDGFNVREVQELLRHADIRTTVIYTHISQSELGAKIRRREAS